ncbi:hypothetical protein LPJ61_002009 [Coemansia biformis]|uniref:BHLH domain-containing protein n=1 Tax=Coemansia biformis TaxID=1286918 RepID=A0A9W8CWT7_9FUNG|nr:hypothetical protein LPJ61_002009 [Coemansia biformis]
MGAVAPMPPPMPPPASHGGHYAHSDYYRYGRVHSYPSPMHAHHARSPAYDDCMSAPAHLLVSPTAEQGDARFPAPTASNAEERENKRRVAHSAMERRRRERTNSVIDKLKAMIPWLRDEARMQKLEVLEQCVCYIRELQQSADAAAGGGGAHSPPASKRKRGQSWPGSECDSDSDEGDSGLSEDAGGSAQRAPHARRTRRRRTGSPAGPASDEAPASSRVGTPGAAGHRLGSQWPAAVQVAAAPGMPGLASDSSGPSTASSAFAGAGQLRGTLLAGASAMPAVHRSACTTLPPIKTAIGFLTR